MKFLIYFEIDPENRNENFRRLKIETGEGVGIGEGTKLLSAWVSATLLEGWCIVEAESATGLGETMKHWTDLNVNHITPVLSGDEVLELFP